MPAVRTQPVQLKQGYLQIYTGSGKGKTTAALGLALRAKTAGLRVAFIQFMKFDGERACAEQVGMDIYRSFGKNHATDGWYHPRKDDEPLPTEVTAGWRFSQEIIAAGAHDLVILDEINVAIAFNFLSPDDVVNTLQRRPAHVEIICTGRGAPSKLLAIADLITDLHEVKHMFHSGILARKGIDF